MTLNNMDLTTEEKEVLVRVYRKKRRRDIVADEIGIETKNVKVVERSILKKLTDHLIEKGTLKED